MADEALSVGEELAKAFEVHTDAAQLVGSDDGYADDNPMAASEAARKASEAQANSDADDDEDDGDREGEGEGERDGSDGEQSGSGLDAEPPIRWTKDEKETWEALKSLAGKDAEALPVIEKALGILGTRNKEMERGLTQRFQELAAERQGFQETAEKFSQLDRIIAPYRDEYARMGTNEAAILQQTLALEKHARERPAEFLTWFAQQRGFTQDQLREMFGIEQQQAAREVVVVDQDGNPIWSGTENAAQQPQQAHRQQQAGNNFQMPPQLMSYLQGMQNELAELRVSSQDYQRSQAAQYDYQAQQQVTEFANATDANGNPLHPFYDDVRGDMANFLTANPNLSLEQAYNAAVAANPTLSQQMWESREIALRRQQEQAARGEAQRARRAGASLPTSSVNVNAPINDGRDRSLAEEISANVAQFMTESDFV